MGDFCDNGYNNMQQWNLNNPYSLKEAFETLMHAKRHEFAWSKFLI